MLKELDQSKALPIVPLGVSMNSIGDDTNYRRLVGVVLGDDANWQWMRLMSTGELKTTQSEYLSTLLAACPEPERIGPTPQPCGVPPMCCGLTEC